MTTEVQPAPRNDPYNLIGARLGDRYKILEAYRSGGMGLVYKASDTQLHDQPVAIKVLSNTIETKREEFEGLALAKLEHPHIVSIRALGTTPNGLKFIVMDWVPGELDLRNVPLEQVADYLDALASALDYAHQNGVLHRDVKLSNVRLNSIGQPVLLDFGIAKLLDRDDGPTVYATNPSTLGTPYYKAPETWLDKPQFLPESDQYSLAVLIYQLVTGNLPFKVQASSGSIAGIVHWANAHMKEPPIPPRDYRKDLPPAAAAVILKALSKEPRDRYSDCTEFANAFRTALTSPDKGGSKTVPLLLVTIAILAVILIGGGYILFGGANQTPTSTGFVVALTGSPVPAVTVSNSSPEPPTIEALKPTDVLPTLSVGGSSEPQVGAQAHSPEPISRPTITETRTASLPSTVTATPSPLPSATPSPIPSATLTNTTQPTVVKASNTPTATPTIDVVAVALAQRQTAVAQMTVIPLTVNPLLTQTATLWTKTPTATLTPTPSITPTITPTAPGGPGLIAFTSKINGSFKIFTMRADGSGVKQLTNGQGNDQEPTWSPNGKTIAFYSDRSGKRRIYTMNADGTARRLIDFADVPDDNKFEDMTPAWSPDGTQFVFVSTRHGSWKLYTANVDGSKVSPLTNDVTNGFEPKWSPDGTKISFQFAPDGQNYFIFLINSDGTNLRRLPITDTLPKGQMVQAHWSPDGSTLAFSVATDATHSLIYVVNQTGSGLRMIFPSGGAPNWSADGSQIVFSDTHHIGDDGIFVVSAGRGIPQKLFSGTEAGYPAWQPRPN